MKNKTDTVTIADIAKKADVSVMTVSRVINGSNNVKKDTRTKVLRIIDELNYFPNSLARGLMKKKSNMIGIVIPSIKNPFFAELISGIENVLYAHDYSMLLCDTGYGMEKQSKYLTSLVQQQAEGIVIIGHSPADKKFISKIMEKTHIIGLQSIIAGCDFISCDLIRGAFIMTEHLIRLGHRKIAFIGDKPGKKSKIIGFTQAMAEYGIPVHDQFMLDYEQPKIPKEESAWDAGYILTKKLLEMPETPTAIQAMNDFYAIGAYQAVAEAGLRIPDDISICGFDNIGVSRVLNPPLTTIEQHPREQGKICGELLIKRISALSDSDAADIPYNIVLPTSLVIRSSTSSCGNDIN